VVAYADDVTIFVTAPADFEVIREAVRQYRRAFGACLNVRKSKTLTIGGWDTTENVLGVDFHPTMKILGITSSSTVEGSMHESWAQMTGKARAQAKNAYGRNLCLGQRVRYLHIFLSAKIWYTAQNFPAPVAYTQQMTTAIAWYIWQGATFRVPMSTLQRPKKQGGWALLDISVKCRELLLKSMWVQSTRERTSTATWLKAWDLAGPQAKPPDAGRIPKRLAYLQHYVLDMAYVSLPGQDPTPRQFMRRFTTPCSKWQWRKEDPGK
jgi:hypothetical protein